MKVIAASRRDWELRCDPRVGGGREVVDLYIGCFADRIFIWLSLIILVSIIFLVKFLTFQLLFLFEMFILALFTFIKKPALTA